MSTSSSFTHIYSHSDELRTMFMKINPYHFSCPYKEAFGEHALDALRNCDDEFDTFLQFDRRKADCAPISYDEDTMEAEEGDDTEEQEQDGRCFVTDFFKNVSPGKIHQQEDCGGYCAWITCKFRHHKYVNLKFLSSGLNSHSFGRFSSARAINTTRRVEGMDADQSRVIHIVRITSNDRNTSAHQQEPSTESRQARSTSDATLESWSWKYRGRGHKPQQPLNPAQQLQRLKSPGIPQNVQKNEHTVTNRPSKPITYKFKHNMPSSFYIKVYREVYTVPHMSIFTRSLSTKLSPSPNHSNKMIAKARIHCNDVRNGAKVCTTGSLSKLYFNVYHKLKTARANNDIKPPSSGKMSSREFKVKDDSLQVQAAEISTRVPSARSASEFVSPAPYRASQPVVNRSRPSIPSNAHGVICDTAIETPSYSVSIRGKSFAEDKSRPGSSGSASGPRPSSDQIHRRGHHHKSNHHAWSR